MTKAIEWEDGRQWTVRYRHEPAFDRPLEVIGPVVDGLFDFAGELFEPLALEAQMDLVDQYGFHGTLADIPHWCLEVDVPGAKQAARWDPPETREAVSRIDPAAVRSFLSRAADQPPEDGDVVCPGALFVTSVRAKLPPPWEGAGEVLEIAVAEGWTAHVAIERDDKGAWVRGPASHVTSSPIHIYGRTQGLESSLRVTAHWSPWYEDDQQGTRWIEDAIATLVAKGWKRS